MNPQTSTILIVDDQAAGRDALEALLFGPDYTLGFAGDGLEALQKAAELIPDLILLDVMMPGMDGYEVCRALRHDPKLAEVPIVMVTALDDQESRLKGIEVGADDFISKPFNRSELRARVRTITRLNRYRRLQVERAYRQEAEAEVRRRNYELILLNHVITLAASMFNISDILYIACEALATVFNVPQAMAMLLKKDQTQFDLVVEYLAPALQPNQAKVEPEPTPEQPYLRVGEIPIAGLLSEYLSTHKSPLAIQSEQSYPQLAPIYNMLLELGFRSLLVIPILTDNRVAGMIELKTAERRSFSNQELTLAESFGTAIGKTLESALLYQKLQQRAATLEETVSHQSRKLPLEHKHIRAILEVLNEAVAITDADGLIQYLNPAMVALSGFSVDEAVGQNWRLWQRTQTATTADEDIATKIEAGQIWRGEVVNKRKDGAPYHAVLKIIPLPAAHREQQFDGFALTISPQ